MRLFFFLLAVLLLGVCVSLHGPFSVAENDAMVAAAFGDPLPGLSAASLRRFENGKSVFARRFKRSTGLGPHFNTTACVACHEEPAVGGSAQRYGDFFLVGQTQEDGTVRKMYPDCTAENAPRQATELCLPSLVIPNYGPRGTIAEPVAAAVEHPGIPAGADVVARRNAPPLFGVGLFRLVSDVDILARADPDDADGDGISGRVNIIANEENRLGRFGYKCQTASIEAFNRGAFNNQLGITSDSTDFRVGDAFRPEVRGAGDVLLGALLGVKSAHAQVAEPKDRITDFDTIPDPEIRRGDLLDLIFFQENLAAPRSPWQSSAERRSSAGSAAPAATSPPCRRPWGSSTPTRTCSSTTWDLTLRTA